MLFASKLIWVPECGHFKSSAGDAQQISTNTGLCPEPRADGTCAGGSASPAPHHRELQNHEEIFSKHLYLLCFSRCLLPEPAALSEGLTCWTMKPPEELLTVELTKAGRQHFMHNPYAAHLKLIQQQKVQMERAQLLLFWCWQLSEEYQQFLKIILALLIGKHFQVQSEPAAMWLRWTSHRFLVQNTFVASTWRRGTTKTASMQHSTALV